MHRVAVFSDVHGNAVALETVLSEMRRLEPDLVVFGGDLTWGPQPSETLALVRGLEVRARFVRGNAERMLLETGKDSERKTWLLERHSADELEFVRSFEEQFAIEVVGLAGVRFCHGSPRTDTECVTPETPEARIREWPTFTEGVVVAAHTHVQFDREVAGLRSVNAGSVGMAYEGSPGGAYWALLGPDVELRRTAFSVDDAVAAYEASGDPATARMAENLTTPPTREEAIEHGERVVFAD